MEDIKQTETTFERGDTIDRNDWSSSNNRIRYYRLGYTTLTIHRIEHEQNIQRIRRGMLGLTQTSRHKDIE